MKLKIKLRGLSVDQKWIFLDIMVPRADGESRIGKTMQIGKEEEFELEEETMSYHPDKTAAKMLRDGFKRDEGTESRLNQGYN